MRNIIFIINSILIISVVALSGCQKKKPVEEAQSQELEKVVVEPAPQHESHFEAEKATGHISFQRTQSNTLHYVSSGGTRWPVCYKVYRP
jgi:hypothetical protein